MAFTISINGAAAVDIQSLRGRVASRRQINQGAGSCRLEFVRRLGETPPVAFDDLVRIWMDGAGYFYGQATAPAFRNDGGSGLYSVEIRDPWGRLDELNFCRGYGPDDGSPTGDFDVGFVVPYVSEVVTSTTIGGYLSTRTILGRSGLLSWTDFLTFDEQMTEIMTYGSSRLTKSGGATFGLPSGWLGFSGPAVVLPEEIANLKTSEVATKLLRWAPDAATWFDYAGLTEAGHPSFYLGKMSTATPRVIPIGGRGGARVQEIRVRDDMRVAGVVLRFENTDGSSTPYRIYNWWTPLMQQYPAGTQANNPRVFAQALNLPTDYLVPANLAELLYNALSARVVEGTLTLVGRDLDLSLRPGLAVELSGDDAAWPAGARLYVQEVTDDPANGTQTLRCGYPGHLGVTDLRTLSQSIQLSLYLGRRPAAPI